ncbi:MAG: hypothetical protein KGS10_00560, partial [Chloroflexi bacterium]|nr:hypothetical protein [Chloroflexota bacterium]
MAALIAFLGTALQLGITLTQLTRPVVLWALQLVLHPETPTAIVATAAIIAVVLADRRGFVALPWAADYVVSQSRRVVRWARPALPIGAAMVASGIATAALYPDAMQGWFRPDPPDAQAYNIYSSFFNYSISKDKIVEFEGYELGEAGLMLAPGRTGVLTFALARPGGSLVLLRPNFYNKTFLNKTSQISNFSELYFYNKIELSLDGGTTYVQVVENESFGQVFRDININLTPYLNESRDYRLRFWASNPNTVHVLVLPLITVSVIVDPYGYPGESFPIVIYAMIISAGLFSIADAVWRMPRNRDYIFPFLLTMGITGLIFIGVKNLPWSSIDYESSVIKIQLLCARVICLSVCVSIIVIRIFAKTHGTLFTVRYLCLLSGVATAIAIEYRWRLLYERKYDFLFPDAQGYLQIARSFSDKMQSRGGSQTLSVFAELYHAGFDGRTSYLSVFFFGNHNGREPLWPAMLDIIGSWIGYSAFHTRLTSLILGALVVGFTLIVGSRTVHVGVGIIAGLLVSMNEPHMLNNIQGLREELVTVLLMSLVVIVWNVNGVAAVIRRAPTSVVSILEMRLAHLWPFAGVTLPRWRVAGAALACAGIILTRADMIVTVSVILGTLAIAYRWGWRTWLPMGATIFVL